MNLPKHLIFLDFDGVITSVNSTPGALISHSPDKYGPSKECLDLVMKLADQFEAKIIITSNWRNFDENAYYSYHGMRYFNPIINLKKILGSRYICDIHRTRHTAKSVALADWLKNNKIDLSEYKYVVLDDDSREGYAESEFKDNYIQTNPEKGFSFSDYIAAYKILSI